MPSNRGKVDGFDVEFVLARIGFLVLGALGAAILSVAVPQLEESSSEWAPILAVALTAIAEMINRIVRDNTQGED